MAGRLTARPPLTARVPAPLLVVTAVVSVQFGGALAATLVPIVGAVASVALRLVFSCAVLLVVARPTVHGRSRSDWLTVAVFGAVLASMNLCFYGSLARLPIGVAVTIEFVGPLTLAAVLSRRLRDLAAVAAAAVGVVAISGALSTPWSRLDLTGLGLALAAGACWAAYIVMSGRTGARFPALDGLAIAMTLSALVVGPIGLLTGGAALGRLDTLWRGLGIAVLSSAIPYALELVALRRLSAQVFGILLSLEPALAALAGLVILHQRLGAVELAGMACVVAASAIVLGARPADRSSAAEPAPRREPASDVS